MKPEYIKAVNGYWVEEPSESVKLTALGHPELDDTLCESEKHINWQKQYFGDGRGTAPFSGTEQTVLIGSKSLDPVVIVSIVKVEESFQALFRSAQGYKLKSMNVADAPNPWYRRLFGLGPSKSAVAQALFDLPSTVDLTEVPIDDQLTEALAKLDETQVHRTFKFGVLYRGPGQTSEEDMFNNDSGSEEYKKFLSVLGDTITLNGWKRFRGDLDVKADTTGSQSVFTEWRGYQVMFHVATLLPKMKNDRQQIERKRHLGNDIVIVVFNEDSAPYVSNTVVSHQNHVVFVVKPESSTHYRVELAARNGVEKFLPSLPSDFLIPRNEGSHDYLLNKFINAERASYGAEGFEKRVQKVRESLIRNFVSTFMT